MDAPITGSGFDICTKFTRQASSLNFTMWLLSIDNPVVFQEESKVNGENPKKTIQSSVQEHIDEILILKMLIRRILFLISVNIDVVSLLPNDTQRITEKDNVDFV